MSSSLQEYSPRNSCFHNQSIFICCKPSTILVVFLFLVVSDTVGSNYGSVDMHRSQWFDTLHITKAVIEGGTSL